MNVEGSFFFFIASVCECVYVREIAEAEKEINASFFFLFQAILGLLFISFRCKFHYRKESRLSAFSPGSLY